MGDLLGLSLWFALEGLLKPDVPLLGDLGDLVPRGDFLTGAFGDLCRICFLAADSVRRVFWPKLTARSMSSL